MKQNRHDTTPILILLSSSIIILVVFILSQSKSIFWQRSQASLNQTPNGDLGDWETHTNRKMSFIVKYPAKWKVHEADFDVTFYSPDLNYEGSVLAKGAEIRISLLNNPNNLSLTEIVQQGKQDFESTFPTEMKISVKEIAPIDGFRSTKVFQSIGDEETTFVLIQQSNKKYFRIGLVYGKSSQQIEYSEIFNQILSTFKFLGETNPTADWKIFSNDTLSFSYPPNWEKGETSIFGSRSETEFTYQYGKPLYLRYLGNYNQITGNPYGTLDEYLKIWNKTGQDITVSSYQAKYIANPGGGHTIAFEEVVFFTPNEKGIISLYFQPRYYNESIPSETFSQILSTFKFIE